MNIPVLVLVLLVDAAHERSSGRQDLVDEDEDGLLGGQLDPLADHVDELAYGEICGNEVLLLIDGSDVALFHLLADDLWSEGSSVTVLRAFAMTERGGSWMDEADGARLQRLRWGREGSFQRGGGRA